MTRNIIMTVLAVTLLGCKSLVTENPYKGFELKEFDLKSGYAFVHQIDDLASIETISLVDIKSDGKEFIVNKQHVFIDTSYLDKPNFYSYKRRAKEIGVNEADLLQSLIKFYNIRVNEFQRTDRYYIFKVEKFLTTNEKGYLYSKNEKLNVNDTISYLKYVTRKLKIKKQMDDYWFEYEEIK